jgi:signal transduction histidine kinase/DNA-binding response OmpR family regulator
LKPIYKVFTLGYSALNYNAELLNKYEYKLEGFDEDWIRSEFSLPVTYTNINPGTYTFKIRATNAVYKPISKEKSIEIIIIPPFYRTWIAFIIYGLTILGLILLINSSYLGKIRLRYELQTERKERERVKELNQYKLRFFTNVSHEFMTPLTIMLSSIENIFSRETIPAKLKKDLNLAHQQARRLKRLNTELLDFRRIEQGYLKLKFIKTDIVEYLSNVYNSFVKIAEERDISYNFENDLNERRIYFDPVQLDKVFYNLLSNAFKHVAEPVGRILLSISEQENVVVISVRNNGKVITREDIEKVFNRFIQLDDEYKKSKYKGSGIGLALSQSIVQAHQGSISCESSKKEGTRFEVRLPKGKAHIDPDLVVQEIERRDSSFIVEIDLHQELESNEYSDGQIGSHTVSDNPVMLIVDDDQEILSAVKRIFSDTYQIETAINGKEGLEMALKIQPEIIISDVVMPTMSGIEMLKKLKRNLNTSHIPIILLTALDSKEDHTSGLYSGADSFINKPFDLEILNATVTSIFQNRKILQEKFNLDPESNAGNIAKNIMDQEFIKKAQAVVERHLTDFDFNVDEFSSKMNIRRTLFYHKVKNITGQTPNDFIQTIRLKHAAKMILTEPSKNFSEIAYDTGFNSPRYFSQCFKNHFGVTPSAYVKEQGK